MTQLVFPWREAPSAEFAVIGDPVNHSLSPVMHAAAMKKMDLPYRYVAIHVPKGEVAEALDFLRGKGYIGVNATIPHKVDALKWAEAPDSVATSVGAANTLKLTDKTATNTDVDGFMSSAKASGLKPDATVLVLGSGGAARSAVYGLSRENIVTKVWNRTSSKAEQMVESLGAKAQIIDTIDLGGSDFIVNSTSTGLADIELPIDWSQAEPHAIAYDMAYGLNPTPFLSGAAKQGLATCDGLDMLAAQGALALQWWLGTKAPLREMRLALERAIRGDGKQA